MFKQLYAFAAGAALAGWMVGAALLATPASRIAGGFAGGFIQRHAAGGSTIAAHTPMPAIRIAGGIPRSVINTVRDASVTAAPISTPGIHPCAGKGGVGGEF